MIYYIHTRSTCRLSEWILAGLSEFFAVWEFMRRVSGPSFGVFVAHSYNIILIIIIASPYDGTYTVTSIQSCFVLLITQPYIFYVIECEKKFLSYESLKAAAGISLTYCQIKYNVIEIFNRFLVNISLTCIIVEITTYF